MNLIQAVSWEVQETSVMKGWSSMYVMGWTLQQTLALVVRTQTYLWRAVEATTVTEASSGEWSLRHGEVMKTQKRILEPNKSWLLNAKLPCKGPDRTPSLHCESRPNSSTDKSPSADSRRPVKEEGMLTFYPEIWSQWETLPTADGYLHVCTPFDHNCQGQQGFAYDSVYSCLPWSITSGYLPFLTTIYVQYVCISSHILN